MKNRVLVCLGFALTTTVHASNLPEKVSYQIGADSFQGLFLKAKSKKAPGVLLVPNWMGVTEESEKQARRFNELGYNVFVADIYGEKIRPKNPKDAGAQASLYKANRLLFRERLEASLKQLRQNPAVDPRRLAVLGYCFGGTGAIELARAGADLRAAISFHGGLDSPAPSDGASIKASVLALHGADDPLVKPADLEAFVAEMTTHKIDFKLISYPGAVHSFTDVGAGTDHSKGAAYSAAADQASFAEAKAQLKRSFK